MPSDYVRTKGSIGYNRDLKGMIMIGMIGRSLQETNLPGRLDCDAESLSSFIKSSASRPGSATIDAEPLSWCCTGRREEPETNVGLDGVRKWLLTTSAVA